MQTLVMEQVLNWSRLYCIDFMIQIIIGRIRNRYLKKLTFHPGVNFINIFTYKFFVLKLFRQLFLVSFWLWWKICTKNVCVKLWWNRRLNWSKSKLLLLIQFTTLCVIILFTSLKTKKNESKNNFHILCSLRYTLCRSTFR